MKRLTNVIPFPQDKIAHPERVGNIGVVELNSTIQSHLHVSQTLEDVLPLVLNKLEERGFFVDKDDQLDGCLFVEALRSLLLKCFDIDHPFQSLSKKIFIENPTTGNFNFADVKVEIKK